MRYLPAFFCATLLFFSSCVKDRALSNQTVNTGLESLIHYWNFNGTSTTTPAFTIGGGALSFDFTTVSDTTGYADLLSPVVPATNINARNGDAAGNALRVRNPCTDFIITAPTTGYKNIIVSYSVAKSSNGALTNTVYYTVDGVNYINSGISPASYSLTVDPAYVLETYDFSSIAAVNNNPDFKFKIVFSDGNLSTSGNDRYDNITVDGTSISRTVSAIPVISSNSVAIGTVGTVFAGYAITASNTATSFSVVNLPPGLNVNSATGLISGTPTTAGTFIDTIKATNANGTGTQVLTITINPVATIALLHYWNFNNATDTTSLKAQDPASVISGGALTFDFTTVRDTTGYFDAVASTAGSQNARDGDVDGSALRVRNPSADFIISAPTTNYQNIVLNYAVEGSSTKAAALTNTISYTTDGINYISAGLASVSYSLNSYIDPTYTLATFDFSTIPAVNNNPTFKIKISFSNGNLNTSGNDRFDNITVEGYHQ